MIDGLRFLRIQYILLFLFITPVSSILAFDHNHLAWDLLLKKNVKNGLVDYVSFQQDAKKLNEYLSSISSVSGQTYSQFSENQKLAFLINAYNAFTVKLVVDNYPVKSIKDIGGFLGSPWKKEFFTLLGEKHHLDWIEHEKLRKDFREPRIHFAINCASMGCPPLLGESFKADLIRDQLKKITRSFLKDPHKNNFDASKKVLYLSKIMDWFKEDFTREGATLIDFYNRNSGASIPMDTKIQFNDYDWDLNQTR
ncbi:hypothetical protein CH373_07105 [Leptospira perolatii]|uniref:DUF547 domain-containing protein n=1 Tax=Leptospira perolatii TaxID=2023191 RepID=A0A2M9ZPI0_9LEPT|nr:DUF547 domain-containing protein [Leptospira perolatii]PJZ70691.1 hypothetical protein CH360_03965 [Leptospira perolatii]PJZ73901.1 hypothetical protein CH373_07105 [Leptospira perolatii]